MKRLIALALFVSLAAHGAPAKRKLADCAKVKQSVQSQLATIGKYMDGGYGSYDTKSQDPKTMITEFMKEHYSEVILESDLEEDVELVQPDDGIATVTKAAAISSIVTNVKYNYLTDENGVRLDKEAANKRILMVEEAATQLMNMPNLRFGYHGGAQGWGGSPASELFLIHPRCRVLYSLFLGITRG